MALNTKKYYNRDLSWLRFNHRVLQEAADKRNPLYERLRFLAIFSSNLDEFFKVRVSEIRKISQLDKPLRKTLVTKPNKLLREIKRLVYEQQEAFGAIFKIDLLTELKAKGIEIIDHLNFDKTQKTIARRVAKELDLEVVTIEPDATQAQPLPFVPENESLYLTALMDDGKIVLVKIPEQVPRFFSFPKRDEVYFVTFIDDIIKYHLGKLYKTPFYALKISRDAELYIDNEYSGNLVAKIKEALGNRDTGSVMRALVDRKMPKKLLRTLLNELNIDKTAIIKGVAYHNFKDFFAFPNPENRLGTFQEFHPKRLADFISLPNYFEAIRTKDRLSYFPYESFEDVLGLLQAAAKDKDVTDIKITLYRIAQDSAVAKLLLQALQHGKKVYVFMECKARFDEDNNIKWGKQLQEKGATVQYSHPGIKVHSKLLYISRKEADGAKGYAYIGTGNFNEKTAKIYTDLGLYTANKTITTDVAMVFQALAGKISIPKTHLLLVAPFSLRTQLSKLIKNEMKNARLGKKAYIIMKLNSLQDEKMMDLLYEANTAGVNIRLIVRGICCLVPGIKGQSENIKVTSIVHRFLEHARVYLFGNGGEEKIFMGSADLMTRNLDHRIEVIAPVLDSELKYKIRAAIDLQLNERAKARIIDAHQKNTYLASVPKKVANTYFTKT